MGDGELEGIRSDVRTLRTDLGLDLESKKKKDLGDEEKRNKLNSDKEIKKAISTMSVKQNDDIYSKNNGRSTINAYFSAKVSSNQDSLTNNKNTDKDDNKSDGNSDDKSDSRIDVSAAHTTPITVGDLDLNLESVGGGEPYSLESVDGLDVTMFTPSILLLVDEIAALEKDILNRHTDITAAQVISFSCYFLFFIYILLLPLTLTLTLSLPLPFALTPALNLTLAFTLVLPSVPSLLFNPLFSFNSSFSIHQFLIFLSSGC